MSTPGSFDFTNAHRRACGLIASAHLDIGLTTEPGDRHDVYTDEMTGSGRNGGASGIRERRREQTRRRILDATMAIASEHGMSAATIKAIAEASEMTPSHLLYYYPSREQILLEALIDNEKSRNAAVVTASERAEPGERLTAAIMSSLPDGPHDREWLFWFGALEFAARDVEAWTVVKDLDAAYRRLITDILLVERADRALSTECDECLSMDVDLLIAGADGLASGLLASTLSADRRERLVAQLVTYALHDTPPGGCDHRV